MNLFFGVFVSHRVIQLAPSSFREKSKEGGWDGKWGNISMQSFFLTSGEVEEEAFPPPSIPSPPLFLFSSRCFNSVLPSSSFLPSSLLGHLAPLEFFPPSSFAFGGKRRVGLVPPNSSVLRHCAIKGNSPICMQGDSTLTVGVEKGAERDFTSSSSFSLGKRWIK